MAQKLAALISKENLCADSRFVWASSLSVLDASEVPAIIFHSCSEPENEYLAELVSIHKKDPSKKFIYINENLSPLTTMLFHGLGGDIYNDEFVLSDVSILLSLLDDYNTSDFRIREPDKEFEELSGVMRDIISDTIDPDRLANILSSRDWRTQVKASMASISTTLVRCTQTSTELSTYVDNTQKAFQSLNAEYLKAKSELELALENLNKREDSAHTGTISNRIVAYPAVRVPMHVRKVLYIVDLGVCPFLITTLLAYAHFLKTKGRERLRLLVIERSSKTLEQQYLGNGALFYNLNKDSIAVGSRPTQSSFVTFDPRKNVFDYFFSCANQDEEESVIFVVVDRFHDNTLLTASGNKQMSTLHAVSGTTMMNAFGLDPRRTIRAFAGDPSSYVIPYIPMMAKQTTEQARLGCLFQVKEMRDLYAKFNKLLDITDCDA